MSLESFAVRVPFVAGGRIYWGSLQSSKVKVYQKKPLVLALTFLIRVDPDDFPYPPAASVPPDLGLDVE